MFSLGWDLPFQNLRIWIACVKHVWIHLDLKCHVVLGGFPESESITIFYSTRNWKRLVKIRNQPLPHLSSVIQRVFDVVVGFRWYSALDDYYCPRHGNAHYPHCLRCSFSGLHLELDITRRWTSMTCLFRLTVPKGFNNILSTIHSNQSWSKFTHALPASNGFSMPPEPASKGHLCGWNKSLKPQRSQGETFKSLLFFGRKTHGYTWDVSKFGTARQSLEMIGLCWWRWWVFHYLSTNKSPLVPSIQLWGSPWNILQGKFVCFVCLFLIFVSIQNSSEMFGTPRLLL